MQPHGNPGEMRIELGFLRNSSVGAGSPPKGDRHDLMNYVDTFDELQPRAVRCTGTGRVARHGLAVKKFVDFL